MVANLTQVLSLLITANHIADYYEIVTAYGHVSVRNPLNSSTFFMTGWKTPPALVTSRADLDEFLVEDGSPVGNTSQPYFASEHPPGCSETLSLAECRGPQPCSSTLRTKLTLPNDRR